MGPLHPYGFASVFPSAGVGMGFEDSLVNELYELVSAIKNEKSEVAPSFFDGWKVNEIIDAIQKSNLTQNWVSLQA
jgi:predicted dehydrogenase